MRAWVRWALAALLVVVGVAVPGATASADGTDQVAFVDVAVATLWTKPGIDRPVDAPAVGNPVDLRAWTGGMTLSQRLDLVGKLETQALYGTPVSVIERSGDWVHVAVHGQPTPRNDLGYPGWMPAEQLTTSPSFAALSSRPFAMVTAPTTELYADMRRTRPLMELSADTRLPELARSGGSVLVATPDHQDRWVAADDVAVYDSPDQIPAPTGDDLVRTAEMFVGLHYLWAGTSAFGFDCSGFTHTVYDLHGITIPRDAAPQSQFGTPVAKDDLRKGDLIFYAHNHGLGSVHHVGMYIGNGYEIDAPINTATTESPLEIVKVDEHRYADEYAGARRVLP
jgi:gamma-D-glutamyl-L-lysine dipeptidyl-peptidase